MTQYCFWNAYLIYSHYRIRMWRYNQKCDYKCHHKLYTKCRKAMWRHHYPWWEFFQRKWMTLKALLLLECRCWSLKSHLFSAIMAKDVCFLNVQMSLSVFTKLLLRIYYKPYYKCLYNDICSIFVSFLKHFTSFFYQVFVI